jgi:DNA-binding transcriptional regulator LsrR (DeoR family)
MPSAPLFSPIPKSGWSRPFHSACDTLGTRIEPLTSLSMPQIRPSSVALTRYTGISAAGTSNPVSREIAAYLHQIFLDNQLVCIYYSETMSHLVVCPKGA